MEEKETKIQKIGKILKNRKYRAVITLFLYFIFFFILFSMANLNGNDNYNGKDNYIDVPNNLLNDYQSYYFEIELNINNQLYNFSGSYIDDTYSIDFNENNYNFKLSDTQNIDLNKDIINSLNYNLNFINEVIKNSELISEKNILTDNSKVDEYTISLYDYLNLNDIYIKEYDKEDLIYIYVTIKDDNIVAVELNLDNLYKYYEEEYNKYNFKINIKEINEK